jgi:hypothetical protein
MTAEGTVEANVQPNVQMYNLKMYKLYICLKWYKKIVILKIR